MKRTIISSLLAAVVSLSSIGISAFAEDNFFAGDDKIDVVFLGGSITEGTSGSFGTEYPSGKGYATYVDAYLKETYGTDRVVYHNSGIGGTGSDFGFNRLYDMGIKYDPDLVFVEFAVNDYWSMEGTRNTMEAIVRGLQTMDNPPYIVFVYTAQYNSSNTSDISNSTNAANWQQEVADYYGIPSINLSEDVYKPYVAKRVSEGAEQLTAIKEFLSTDYVHPTANGHRLYGEYIVEKLRTGEYYKKAAVKDDWYVTDEIYDYVPHGVSITSDMITGTYSKSSDNSRYILDTGSSLTYTFSGPMIGAYTFLNKSGGQYEVSVDGKVVQTPNGYRNQGYDQRWLGFWIRNIEGSGEHVLRLTVKSGKLDIKNLYEANGHMDSLGSFCINNLTATNADGEVITAIVPGSLNIMNTNIQNIGAQADFTAVTAFYRDGRLYSVGTYSENAAAGEKLSFGIGFTAPQSGNVTAKTMLWSGLGDAKPLSSAMTLPVSE